MEQIALTPDLIEKIDLMTQNQLAINETLNSLIAYVDQIYRIGIIIPSILFSIGILYMIYRALMWFAH